MTLTLMSVPVDMTLAARHQDTVEVLLRHMNSIAS